jgi:hypothetical protein
MGRKYEVPVCFVGHINAKGKIFLSDEIRELAAILESHDIATTMLTTERPGYVVYEDEFQVPAEPFRNEHPKA